MTTSLVDALSDSSLQVDSFRSSDPRGLSLNTAKSNTSLIIPRKWPTWRLVLLTVAGTILTAFPTSIQFVGLNFPQKEIEDFMHDSFTIQHNRTLEHHELSLLYGAMISTPFLVGLFGSILVKYLLERHGRRKVLFLGCGASSVLSGVLYIVAQKTNSYQLLFVARFIYGFAWASQMNGMPLYLTECCPPEVRGLIPCMLTTMVNVGFFLIYILSLPQVLGGPSTWPYLLLVSVPPSLVAMLAAFTLPESPKYTYLHQRGDQNPEKLAKIIRWFYGQKVNVQKILSSFAEEAHQAELRLSLCSILRTYHLRKALLIAAALAIIRVTCGAMMITVYSTAILHNELGVTHLTGKYAMIGIACSYAVFSALGVYLMERVGRRRMFLSCSLGMIGAELLFVSSSLIHEYLGGETPWLDYLGLVALLSVSAIFQVAPATVTIFYVTEICPHAARASITTFSTILGILGRLVYFLLFPVIHEKLGVYAIVLMFLLPSSAILVYLYMEMPETRQRHVHEIVDVWIQEYAAKQEAKKKVAAGNHTGTLETHNGHAAKDVENNTVKESLLSPVSKEFEKA